MKLRRNKRNDEVERIDKLCDEVRSAAVVFFVQGN